MFAGLPRTRELGMFASRFGRRVWQGRPVRYAIRWYWPCGNSPRLRRITPPFLGTAMVALVSAILPATPRVVLLCVGPVDRNQPRPQRFSLSRIGVGRRKKR